MAPAGLLRSRPQYSIFLGLTCIQYIMPGPCVTFYAIRQWRTVILTRTLSCIASACEGNDRRALYTAFSGALELLHGINEDAMHFISAPPTIQHADCKFPYVSALARYDTLNEDIQFSDCYAPSQHARLFCALSKLWRRRKSS